MMKIAKLVLFGAMMLLMGHAWAKIELKPDHPTEYIVQKGDTLWDIAAKFLSDPWQWPEIWHINQKVRNPHLIYPGNRLLFVIKDGQPMLILDPGSRGSEAEEDTTAPIQTTKLSPRARSEKLDDPIPTIPTVSVGAFLNHALIVGRWELNRGGYVIASKDERLLMGRKEYVYGRGFKDQNVSDYRIYRRGRKIKDGWSSLGYEAIYLGEAKIVAKGDPATLQLTQTTREVMAGDRLLPIKPGDDFNLHFIPKAPDHRVKGRIVSVYDGVSRVGSYQVVVINLGKRDKIEQGHVLGIFQDGKRVRDAGRFGKVRLPEERAGVLMVFRTFKHASYALVMKATTELKVYDTVRNPD